MAAEKTPAIVLKTQDYRDTSLLVTFLTPGFGKIRALVKGGRDARVKLGSTLEPFSLNEVLLYRRRRGDLHLATSAELIDWYPRSRSDCGRLAAASLCCEWVDQLVEGGAHPEIFAVLREALAELDCTNLPAVDIPVARFAIRLLNLLGLLPVLDRCVRCGSAEKIWGLFSSKSGGVVCDACRPKEEAMIRVDADAVRAVGSLRLGATGIGPEEAGRARELLERFLDFHLQYPPHSRRFLDKISQFERKHLAENLCTSKT